MIGFTPPSEFEFNNNQLSCFEKALFSKKFHYSTKNDINELFISNRHKRKKNMGRLKILPFIIYFTLFVLHKYYPDNSSFFKFVLFLTFLFHFFIYYYYGFVYSYHLNEEMEDYYNYMLYLRDKCKNENVFNYFLWNSEINIEILQYDLKHRKYKKCYDEYYQERVDLLVFLFLDNPEELDTDSELYFSIIKYFRLIHKKI